MAEYIACTAGISSDVSGCQFPGIQVSGTRCRQRSPHAVSFQLYFACTVGFCFHHFRTHFQNVDVARTVAFSLETLAMDILHRYAAAASSKK